MDAEPRANTQGRTTDVYPVSLHKLTVRFGTVTALDCVTLTVSEGSICGLVGPNGAGKTTCIRVLAGVLRPAEGVATILGAAVGRLRPVREAVGYLLDEPALFGYLTADETLLFLAEAYGVERVEALRRTEALLRFFDMDRNRTQLVDEYSTGMLKRLAVAAALVHGPRLLILDEPFESLDPLIVRKLKHILVSFAQSGGTVLLSTHLIDVAEEICSDVALLERGKLLLSGKTKAVIERFAPADDHSLEAVYANAVEPSSQVTLDWILSRGTRVSG